MKAYCYHCNTEYTPKEWLKLGKFAGKSMDVPLKMHDCPEAKEMSAARKRYAAKRRYA